MEQAAATEGKSDAGSQQLVGARVEVGVLRRGTLDGRVNGVAAEGFELLASFSQWTDISVRMKSA